MRVVLGAHRPRGLQMKRELKTPSKAKLDVMVDEATVDCNNESEQATGLFTMIEEHLALPFETLILGVPVMVTKVDISDRDEIIAICKRGGVTQRIAILDIPLPSPAPAGVEWIAAYRHWMRGGT